MIRRSPLRPPSASYHALHGHMGMHSGFQTKIKDYIQGSTPLMKAAATGQSDVVRLLLERGANGNHFDNFDRGLVYYAHNISDRRGEQMRAMLDQLMGTARNGKYTFLLF